MPTNLREVPRERSETTCLLRWDHETVTDDTTFHVTIRQGETELELSPTLDTEVRVADLVVGESYSFFVEAASVNGASDSVTIEHKQIWKPSPVKALAEFDAMRSTR